MQVETFAQPRERATTSLVEGLPLAHDGFESVGQQGTDGPPFPSRHAGFPYRSASSFNVTLVFMAETHVVLVLHHFTCRWPVVAGA
jgi:hypothetical protein